jgi:hypothetical protein
MKPRSLRSEMGDVEHHLLSHPSIRKAMVALPTTGPYSDQLTAILKLDSINESNVHSGINIVSKSELEASNFDWSSIPAHLKERLPAYIAPSSWNGIKVMPLHSSEILTDPRLVNSSLTYPRRVTPMSVGAVAIFHCSHQMISLP